MSAIEIAPETLIERLRVYYKRLHSTHTFRRSFCKKCGRDQRDFIAPDHVWQVVEPHIKYGNVLCYDCFFEAWWDLTDKPIHWSITAPLEPVIKSVIDGESIEVEWSP